MFTVLQQDGIACHAMIKIQSRLNMSHKSLTGICVSSVTKHKRRNGHPKNIGMDQQQQESALYAIIRMPQTTLSGSGNLHGIYALHVMRKGVREGMLLQDLYLALPIRQKADPTLFVLERSYRAQAVITLMRLIQGHYLRMI